MTKTSKIIIRCHPRLKALIVREARKRGLSVSAFVVQVLAEHLGRPDLPEENKSPKAAEPTADIIPFQWGKFVLSGRG